MFYLLGMIWWLKRWKSVQHLYVQVCNSNMKLHHFCVAYLVNFYGLLTIKISVIYNNFFHVRQTSRSEHKLVNSLATSKYTHTQAAVELKSCLLQFCATTTTSSSSSASHTERNRYTSLYLWPLPRNQVGLWGECCPQEKQCDGKWQECACLCIRTSPCVPLLQASEKTELTILWDRVWPDVAISDTPLSDWLEWLDWDSGLWSHKQTNKHKEALLSFSIMVLLVHSMTKKLCKSKRTWKAGRTGSWLHGGRREGGPIICGLRPPHCLLKIDVQLLPVLRNRRTSSDKQQQENYTKERNNNKLN